MPGFNAKGGITNYYQSLRKYFPENIYYLKRGSRNWPDRRNNFIEIWRGINDLLKFISFLRREKIQLVQTNTSLSSNAVFRDGLFVLLSKIMNRKVIVFFHGWDYNFVNGSKKIRLKLFKYVFFKADGIIDLSRHNKERLIKWGYNKTIYVETTAVADLFETSLNAETISQKYEGEPDKFNILFLARVEKEKGIYEAINAFADIYKINPKYNLIVAGDGKELESVKKYVYNNKINGCEFLGFVTGQNKLNAFLNAHIYLFTSYSEGMPTTVLEAMACGLPILTTPVGGLVDIFEESKNGYFIDINNIAAITKKLISLSKDRKKLTEIGCYNYQYAKNRFKVQIVASRIISIFEEILEK